MVSALYDEDVDAEMPVTASTQFYVSSACQLFLKSQILSARILSFSSSNSANSNLCIIYPIPAPGLVSSYLCSGVNSSSFPTLNPK